jgi:hypothetical protein
MDELDPWDKVEGPKYLFCLKQKETDLFALTNRVN